MKFLLATIGIIGAGFLGYVLEPNLRYGLTGKYPAAPPVPAPVIVNQPAGAGTAPAAPAYDYSSLQPSQLPEKIVLKVQAFATAPGESDALPLPAGTKVKPLHIEGSDVHFSVLGTAQGKIAVANTNMVEQLLTNPPPAPTTTPTPEPTPVPAPVTPPPVVVENTPPPVVTPMPEKTPEVIPAATPDPAPPSAPISGALSPEDIVKVMQESIRSGQIKEFTFDQVIGWKATENEETDGEKYQTGLAAYKAETIFGVKNIQAKAMIQGGKVVRWIWPTSGLEIE